MARLADSESRLGKEHPETSRATFELARAHIAAGQYGSGVSLLEAIIPAINGLMGADHPEAIWALSLYALALNESGEFERATRPLRQILRIREQQFGEDNEKTVRSLNNLAINLEALGQLDEAKALRERVVAARRRMLGNDDPSTIDAINHLAHTKYQAGEWKAVVDLERQVLQARVRLVGDDSEESLATKQRLASALARAHDTSSNATESLSLIDEVISIRQDRLGKDDRRTLQSLVSKADVLSNIGRVQEAADLSGKILETFDHTLGIDHPLTIEALAVYVNALGVSGGDADRLPALADRLLRNLQRTLGDANQETLTAAATLGIALSNLDRLDEARAVLAPWSMRAKELLGEGHPMVLRLMTLLAPILLELGEHAEASELIESVVRIARPSWEVDSPSSIVSEASCAQLLAAEGKLYEARELAQHANERALASLGPASPIVAFTNQALLLVTM
jgi:tetratricopeptide (TPR) repeat protein